MTEEPSFITISPKIRKQLEVAEEKDQLSYYEALGLKPDCAPEDITRAFNRSRELLCHLKYHPQYKEEAEAIALALSRVVAILENPQERSQYNARLQAHREDEQKERGEDFLHMARTAAEEGSLTCEQKKDLSVYATAKNVPLDRAQVLLDQIPTMEKAGAVFFALPPRLTAPLPRYWETPGFQILLKKTTPLVEKLHILRCAHCHHPVPICHLVCSCGSLMRGKMICLDCAALFPSTALHCPHCSRESDLMLELMNEDIDKVHSLIRRYRENGPFAAGLGTAKDLLAVRPGDQVAKFEMESLKQKAREDQRHKQGEDLQHKGLCAWEQNKAFLTFQILHQTSGKMPLSGEACGVLEQATEILVKQMKNLVKWLLIAALAFLLGILAVNRISSPSAPTSSGQHALFLVFSLAFGICIVSAIVILVAAGKYQNKTRRQISGGIPTPTQERK